MDVSSCEKAIAKHLEDVFGQRPKIFIHRETKDDPFFIGIARVADYPAPGMVTMSTIRTSSYPLFQDDGAEYPDTRVEFITSAQTGQDADMEQALFRAAVFVGKVKGFARPGIFLHNLIGQFRNSAHVPHAFLTTPFAYDGLEDMKVFLVSVCHGYRCFRYPKRRYRTRKKILPMCWRTCLKEKTSNGKILIVYQPCSQDAFKTDCLTVISAIRASALCRRLASS